MTTTPVRTLPFECAIEEIETMRLIDKSETGSLSIYTVRDTAGAMWYYVFAPFGEVVILPFDQP